MLAHAPEGSDGIWPDFAVREVIERLASESLELGVHVGVMNRRGVVSRSIGEGGAQERDLATRYRQQADKLTMNWPRTAAVLYGLAQDYEHQAHREDLEAEAD